MTVSARPITSGLPLLETKLYRPQWSADRVSRSRLLNCIQPQRKLTLVSAPAGFGKMTLLAEWVATASTKLIAWVSLDQGDNDPAFFWTYLITALHNIQPSLGGQSLSLLQSAHPASRADPPLSLARLRSHGDLTELRVSDLRFTADEATAFLNQVMGLEISAAEVSALEQRTEGWIAGL
ncbi:MAG: hypothetical protein AAF572_01565 [Cyanobacteria bacterium P01_B01_bin.77]